MLSTTSLNYQLLDYLFCKSNMERRPQVWTPLSLWLRDKASVHVNFLTNTVCFLIYWFVRNFFKLFFMKRVAHFFIFNIFLSISEKVKCYKSMQKSTCIVMLSFSKHTFIITIFDRTSVFYLFSYPICNLFLTKIDVLFIPNKWWCTQN